MEQNKSKTKPGIAARKAALHLYTAIIDKKTPLSGLIDDNNGSTAYLKLSTADRALVKAILHSTLRNRQQIDHILNSYLKNPLPKGAHSLTYLLHISLAQLLYLRIATFATINTAVDLAKSDSRMRRFHKLVNAILRAALRDITAHNMENKFFMNPIQTIPEWFSQLLIEDYGLAAANSIISASHKAPAIDLTVKAQPQIWAKKLGATHLWGNSLRLSPDCKTDIQQLAGYKTGEWWVQDCASSIPALFLNKTEFRKIADLCAAPGGKTAQLVANNKCVTAFEINKNRCARLHENMKRLRLAPKIINADFQTYDLYNDFDAILLDAPCSSTGTLSKNSDILWTKALGDIKKLSQLQMQLLQAAIAYVKIGGTIIFSNCSLARLEGERVIEALLAKTNKVRLDKITADDPVFIDAPQLRHFISEDGFLRTSPTVFAQIFPKQHGTMDGFFIARLVRSS